MLQKRIINKIRRTCVDTLAIANMQHHLVNSKRVDAILMYHGVDLREETRFNSRFMGLSNFKAQILFLKKYCNIISLSDFFEGDFDKKRSNIAITFDDGYLNNYKYVVPFLNEYKVPATIYVTALNKTPYDILWPDYLDIVSSFTNEEIEIDGLRLNKNGNGKYFSEEKGKTLNEIIKDKGGFDFKEKVFQAFDKYSNDFRKDERYFDYWKLMDDEQLKEVDRSKFVNIESHAYWHNNLGNISLEEAQKELVDSKQYLESLLQKEVTELAYPDGSYSRVLLDFAEKIGFKYQLAAEGYHFKEDFSDERIMDRIGLYPYASWSNQLYDLFHPKQNQ